MALTKVAGGDKDIIVIQKIVKGEQGPQGLPGARGEPGRDGRNGVNGTNGRDGRDGVDGKDGAPGRDGTNGAPGRDGKDGVVPDTDAIVKLVLENRALRQMLESLVHASMQKLPAGFLTGGEGKLNVRDLPGFIGASNNQYFGIQNGVAGFYTLTSGSTPAHDESLLLESGDYLLLEDGTSSLLLE